MTGRTRVPAMHERLARSCRKYLERYAEDDIELAAVAEAAGVLDSPYEECVVIPVFGEDSSLLQRVRTFGRSGRRVLVLVVLNEPAHCDEAMSAANLAFRADVLRSKGAVALCGAKAAGWFLPGESVNVWVLDRSQGDRRFAEREGVGRARKVGGDVALFLAVHGWIHSPGMHWSDADAETSARRFDVVGKSLAAPGVRSRGEGWGGAGSSGSDSSDGGGSWAGSPGAGACLLPFRHVAPEGCLEPAAAIYESWLRYLVLGMEWAGSPYAYHSIGSTIAVEWETYAKVRGAPNRKAGEDFHFLAKVSKCAAIEIPRGEPMEVEARVSSRVPFGTGVGIQKLRGEIDAGSFPRFLSPDCFRALRDFLDALDTLGESGNWAAFERSLVASPRRVLQSVAQSLGAPEALHELCQRGGSSGTLARHLHTWFDALRTIRFLHTVRDLGAENTPWAEALRDAPFLESKPGFSDPHAALEQLRLVEDRARMSGLPARFGESV